MIGALVAWLVVSTAVARGPSPALALSMLGSEAEPTEASPDPQLTADLERLIAESEMLSDIHEDGALSVVLVDISDPNDMRAAMIKPDWEMFTASLSKIIVLLGTVTEVAGRSREWRKVEERAEDMIKGSSNAAAISLFKEVGHRRIRDSAAAHGLYDAERGGLWWVPRDSLPLSPKTGIKICSTARSVARYFVLMEQGRLNNPNDSLRIKHVLHNSKLALLHGGVVKEEPGALYFGKPGVLHEAVSEGMLIEGKRVRYVVAVISFGTDYKDPAWRKFGRDLHKLMLSRHPELKP
jgi:beta-lactamase class A